MLVSSACSLPLSAAEQMLLAQLPPSSQPLRASLRQLPAAERLTKRLWRMQPSRQGVPCFPTPTKPLSERLAAHS